MFKTLNRYLLKQLFLSTLFITIVLTTALWLTQSLRFVEVVISRGFSLSMLFKMVLFLAPDLISLILPMASLMALLFTYNRLMVDSELVVMRSSGMSNFALARPAFINAGWVLVILYVLNLYLLPLSMQQFKNLEHHIRHHATSYLIQPGEFNTFKNITVYVKERRRNGILKGILIHNAQDQKQPFTLTAEEGIVTESLKGASVTLIKGTRQQLELSSRKINILFFDTYTVDLSVHETQQRSQKPYERTWQDLIHPNLQVENPQTLKRLSIELHQRLILPLTVLAFTGIALVLFLRGEYNRRGRMKRIAAIIGLCGGLELCVISMVNLSERWPFMIFTAYSLLFSSLAAALYGLYEPSGNASKR